MAILPKESQAKLVSVTDINGKPLGMDWYLFLVHFGLPAGIFLSIPLGSLLGTIGILPIGFSFLRIIAWRELRTFNVNAPKTILILYILSLCLNIMCFVFTAENIYMALLMGFVSLCLGLPLTFANYIYFQKRAHLFTSTKKVPLFGSLEEKIISEYQETSPKEKNISFINDAFTFLKTYDISERGEFQDQIPILKMLRDDPSRIPSQNKEIKEIIIKFNAYQSTLASRPPKSKQPEYVQKQAQCIKDFCSFITQHIDIKTS